MRHTKIYIQNTKQEAKIKLRQTAAEKIKTHQRWDTKGRVQPKSHQDDKLRRIKQANVVGYGALSESVGVHMQLSDVGAISQLSAINLLSARGITSLVWV